MFSSPEYREFRGISSLWSGTRWLAPSGASETGHVEAGTEQQIGMS